MKYELRKYQQEAVDLTKEYLLSKSEKKPVLLVEPTGCHAINTPIIMADGTIKLVQNIILGDLILGSDSLPHIVTELHRGNQLLYKVTPVRGLPFVVNEDHILSLMSTRERNNPRRAYPGNQLGGEITDIPLKEYLQKSKHWKHLRKLYHPKEVIFHHPPVTLSVPPWFLGIIIGDGSTLNGVVNITSMDDEIISEVHKYAKENNLHVRTTHKNDNKAFGLHLAKHKGSENSKNTNSLIIKLRELGVMEKRAEHKSIPYIYKTSSIQDRLEILAGILDADGHNDGHGSFDYISKSPILASDVAFIARSVGLSVTEKACVKGCQNGFEGVYYRLNISGDIEKIPCKLPRKQAVPRKQKKNPLVTGFKVESIGIGDYYGFTITGNHHYMTGDFFVHHNCGKSLIISNIAQGLDAPLLVFQPTVEILQQNYDKLMSYDTMGVTIYSASMKQKEIGNITLATIGSVYRKPELFKQFKYILIDEADLCNAKGGIYKQFIEAVGEKHCGLTATPYRTNHDGFGGTMMKFLTRTNPRIFSRVLHVTQTRDLLAQGYLANTEYFSINGFRRNEIKLNSTGSDYDEVSERSYYDKVAFDKRIVKVVKRLLEIGKTRILVFTKYVKEAEVLARELGGEAAVVHGEMKAKDRDIVIKDFRAGKIKVVTNCAVLTAGFDYPELEVVVVARPTRSLRLWYQMTGRVVRPDLSDPTKKKMVVDMCNNHPIYGGIADMEIVELGGDNLWAVVSNGRQLTNRYLNQIMSD